MKIQQMFAENIDREINGVVKVDQDTESVIEQEIREYVITNELNKHFDSFFKSYSRSFSEPTANIGVWISGFFGSGKSHFLKMLSYILDNKEVGGRKTADWFQDKLTDSPEIFEMIQKSTAVPTHTILFNIDIEGSINKDDTAVLRVFAKMFYNHLGYYGENLKVAKLEQFIAKQGKTEEFHRIFEEKNGASWIDSRDVFAFFEDDVVDTLMQVLGMSETAARNWFNGTENVETSIAQLVSEIKEYVDGQGDDFRLLFMIDEVGQYVGDNTSHLINLQSLIEKIGSECEGKVWIVCTGQEALDEIIKAREDEFSRIMARFNTRLSLTSSSADEVIQKRVLKKTDEAEKLLTTVYDEKDSVLRNLFTFTDARQDIKGYPSSDSFSVNFPFIPYQFILMQKVFSEIRKHGNTGKHLSGGERSMLSGFQEAAQKIEDRDEMALVPFYRFYDTVHSFLDSSIRRVIERCERAASESAGVETQDIDVLKLLYLIRYVDDVPSNLDNIVVLMADSIDMDKVSMREQVRDSLDRLVKENYIGRVEDTYKFLTDEEQDIQREIYKNTSVNSSDIVGEIGRIIFTDIYTAKKYRYEKYDFPFDNMVDTQAIGSLTGDMLLRFVTVATPEIDKSNEKMIQESGEKAIVVLGDTPYYEALENAMKIRKYVKHKNVAQLPKSVQDIIRNHQNEAAKYEDSAYADIEEAIEKATFYVAGERIDVKSGKAKDRIDQALNYLVSHVYSGLTLIDENVETDDDIRDILLSEKTDMGDDSNIGAASEVEEFLEIQLHDNITTSMADIQSRYQAIPYGWREIDIASVVARLIREQRVTVKYSGVTIQPSNPKLTDMLRKKSEVGKTLVSKRISVSAQNIREARDFLREYFNEMDVPEDEDGLVAHIVEKFEEEFEYYGRLQDKYVGHSYPDKSLVDAVVDNAKDILSYKKDNDALIGRVIERQTELLDAKDDCKVVDSFFKNQVTLFDEAVELVAGLRNDLDYIKDDEETNNTLNTLRLITMIPSGKRYEYKRIPELNDLIARVKHLHSQMLISKRAELKEIVDQCVSDIKNTAGESESTVSLLKQALSYYESQTSKIDKSDSLALLDGLQVPLWKYKDDTISKIDIALQPPEPDQTEESPASEPEVEKVYKSVFRQSLLKAVKLESKEEINDYVENLRKQLISMLDGVDGIELK